MGEPDPVKAIFNVAKKHFTEEEVAKLASLFDAEDHVLVAACTLYEQDHDLHELTDTVRRIIRRRQIELSKDTTTGSTSTALPNADLIVLIHKLQVEGRISLEQGIVLAYLALVADDNSSLMRAYEHFLASSQPKSKRFDVGLNKFIDELKDMVSTWTELCDEGQAVEAVMETAAVQSLSPRERYILAMEAILNNPRLIVAVRSDPTRTTGSFTPEVVNAVVTESAVPFSNNPAVVSAAFTLYDIMHDSESASSCPSPPLDDEDQPAGTSTALFNSLHSQALGSNSESVLSSLALTGLDFYKDFVIRRARLLWQVNLIPIADLVNIAHTLDAGELVLIRKAAAVEDQPDFTVLDEALLDKGCEWRAQSPHVYLLDVLSNLAVQGYLERADQETLDALVLGADEELLQAFNQYASSPQSEQDWHAFLQSLHSCLGRENQDQAELNMERAAEEIDALLDEGRVSLPDAEYLSRLVAVHDDVLMSAMEQFAITHNEEEMQDTLLRLASRWQRSSPHSQILDLVDEFVSERGLGSDAATLLYTLTLRVDATLMNAFNDYAQQLDTNAARARDTLFGVFGELLTETMDDLDDAGAGREDQADGGADSGSVDDEVTSAILEGLDLAFRQSYITLAQKLFLQQLAERKEPVLVSAYNLFRDTNDFTEFVDTLARIGGRWREGAAQDSNMDGLLTTLRYLTEDHVLLPSEYDLLEGIACERDPMLLNAYAVMQAKYDQDPIGATDGLRAALENILNRELDRMYEEYAEEASKVVDAMMRDRELPTADFLSLHDLLRDRDDTLLAVLAEFQETSDEEERADSLRRLGARWRRVSPHQGLLTLLSHLYEEQQLNELDIDWLDALVYSEDDELLSAYEGIDKKKHGQTHFLNTLESLVKRRQQLE